MNAHVSDYDTVLRIIYQWPPADRLALIQDILKNLAPEFEIVQHKGSTLKQALGLLATDEPAPSDEEIERWIAERRLEKSKKP